MCGAARVDQNLILLDEATVYNPSHLLGFFSTFNSDAIKDVTLYKGAIPAEFGGRLASVLDVRMNDGNIKDYVVSGGIGLISSRLNVEGPIEKDDGSFIVSARRTYADVFLKLSRIPIPIGAVFTSTISMPKQTISWVTRTGSICRAILARMRWGWGIRLG